MMLKAPFPWFGGKSRASSLIWSRLGNVPNYVEPFAGSLAVLLLRPEYNQLEHTETVNDLDCFLANFWRALSQDWEKVAYYADYPVNEADLHARHLWLINQDEFRERMMTDPEYCNFKVAGWWVWGLCQWIGSGWCASIPRIIEDDALGGNGRGVHRQRPHLGNNGMGVHRQRPHLGNNGMGVHRQLPHLGDSGRGSESKDSQLLTGESASPASTFGEQRYGGASPASRSLYEYFEALSNRLRRVRVCCGDWQRVLGPSSTERIGLTGIVLDPPYSHDLRCPRLYAQESDISDAVREWAIANGDNPMLRIALCGYSDEHQMPDDWECVEWKAGSGFGRQKRDRPNQNRYKERIWFSPHCIKPSSQLQLSLFEVTA
jgi:hypothetical protein